MKKKKASEQNWQPMNDLEFSEGSLEVYRMFQDRKIKRLEMTKDESYKAIQYFIDNNTFVMQIKSSFGDF